MKTGCALQERQPFGRDVDGGAQAVECFVVTPRQRFSDARQRGECGAQSGQLAWAHAGHRNAAGDAFDVGKTTQKILHRDEINGLIAGEGVDRFVPRTGERLIARRLAQQRAQQTRTGCRFAAVKQGQ